MKDTNPLLKTNACPACREPMHSSAWKCRLCQHTIGWRHDLSRLLPALSLAIAFMALIPTVWPVLFPLKGELSMRGALTQIGWELSFVNTGQNSVIIDSQFICSTSSQQGGDTIRYSSRWRAKLPLVVKSGQQSSAVFMLDQLSAFNGRDRKTPIYVKRNIDIEEILNLNTAELYWVCLQKQIDTNGYSMDDTSFFQFFITNNENTLRGLLTVGLPH